MCCEYGPRPSPQIFEEIVDIESGKNSSLLWCSINNGYWAVANVIKNFTAVS